MSRVHLWKRAAPRDTSLRIGHLDRLLFAKRLALYLTSGVPLLEALSLLQHGMRISTYQRVLSGTYESVQKGIPLSEALARYPKSFTLMQIQLIAIGETSGALPETLVYLADTLSRNMRVRKNIMAALAYPTILLIGTVSISGFLLFYAFPKIIPLFKGLHQELPLPTRILLAFPEHGFEMAFLLGAVVALASVYIFYAARFEKVQLKVHSALLRLPFFGAAIQSYNIALLFRMISVMQHSGARIDVTVGLARNGWRNRVYRASLETLEQTVLSGGKIATGLRASPRAFSTVAVELIAAGEYTGSLSQSARTVAEIYEDQLSDQLARISALLEPLLLLVMASVVGFVSLAIISPIYALTQGLSSQ